MSFHPTGASAPCFADGRGGLHPPRRDAAPIFLLVRNRHWAIVLSEARLRDDQGAGDETVGESAIE